jgi:hypothetical protein
MITASEMVLIVWRFPILSPVELSEGRLVVYGETSEKVDFRYLWLSRFKNAKMIVVYFSCHDSNLLIRISEQGLDFAGCKF